MPSRLHETLVAMFRDQPQLAADVLTIALHIPMPEGAKARASPGDLGELAPTEYRADTVITFGEESAPSRLVH